MEIDLISYFNYYFSLFIQGFLFKKKCQNNEKNKKDNEDSMLPLFLAILVWLGEFKLIMLFFSMGTWFMIMLQLNDLI